MDVSRLWTIEAVPASEVYGRGVDPGPPWVAVFGKPITPDDIHRIVPDPLED
jgi:hypothetical protein